MAAKYQLITELYRRTGVAVAKNPQAWQGFLSSACRNYKCRFDEQLLIYAQRPDAVAVAKLETWNRMFGNMQGRIGFLLIPFLCSRCNIIPQTRFVNPDFPISQFLHIFSTLPYIPSVSGVLCGSDCAVQQSQSSHNDHRARSHLSSIPCPCRADGAYCRTVFLP